MARIRPLEKEEAPPEIQTLYDQVKAVFGMVPNLLKTMAHVPGAVMPFALFLGAFRNSGRLDQRTKELAILMASLQNGCHY